MGSSILGGCKNPSARMMRAAFQISHRVFVQPGSTARWREGTFSGRTKTSTTTHRSKKSFCLTEDYTVWQADLGRWKGFGYQNMKLWEGVGCCEHLHKPANASSFCFRIQLFAQNDPTFPKFPGWNTLGGGFKHFLFSPLFGEDFPIWLIFFRWVVQPPTSHQFLMSISVQGQLETELYNLKSAMLEASKVWRGWLTPGDTAPNMGAWKLKHTWEQEHPSTNYPPQKLT